MKEAIIINIKELKNDLSTAERLCETSSINSTEYAYWNGVRCHCEVVLKRFQKTFELLARIS